MREAASRGFWVGSGTPYGYRRTRVQDGMKGRVKLAPDPNTAWVVRSMFELILSGQGVKEIAKTLNSQNIPSPSGKRWGKSRVHDMLVNPVYVGSLVWGAGGGYHKRAKLSPVRVDHAFEPIVDLSTFDRVQSTLRARAPKASPPRRVSSRYLLSGILRCGRCDAAMFGTGAKSGRFHYYVCATAYRSGKQACITRPLPQSMIEQLVLDNLQKLVLEEEHIEELVHLTNDELRGSLESLKERISGIDSQLGETDRRLGRLYDALETGKIVVEDLAPRIRELRERRDLLLRSKAEAQETVDAGRVELVSRGVVLEYLKDLKGVLDYGSVSERRALLKSFVRSVERHDSEVTVRYTLPLPPETEPTGGPGVLDSVLVGGAGGTRTPDFLRAREALSQLSYSPTSPAAGQGERQRRRLRCRPRVP